MVSNIEKPLRTPLTKWGKCLGLKTDGSAPANNPFADGKNGDPYVYSYGHRSPQGLAVSATGQIWLHEHGPQGGDELNHIRGGNNYGWPATSFGINYSGARVTPLTSAEGVTPPVTYWTPSIAPSHLLIYQGALFETWQGSFLVSTLVDQDVKRLTLDESSVTQTLNPYSANLAHGFAASTKGPMALFTCSPTVTPGP